MAGLLYKSVSKSYGPVHAVSGVDLEVVDGEFLVLLGPSGCGKTTLLRMTAGLEEITGGHVEMDGKRINELPPKDRNIAMVFQNYALYPHLTVAQNIGYPLKIRGVAPAELERKVAAVAAQLGLGALLARRPKELSGGQRQRVALGRAIVRKPGVFLMDEPLSNLDAQLRVSMRAEIKRLQRDLGVTMLYVTHDQVEAMSMASRIAIFKDGALRQVDTPERIFARPIDRFVAGFIGTPPMNFIPGTLTPEGVLLGDANGGYLMRRPHKEIPRPVTVGVRPQHVKFSTGAGLAVKLYVTEPLGDEWHAVVETGVSRLTVKCSADPGLKPGDAAALVFDERELHLFDAQTGKRMQMEESR
ncbi:MAG: ABC transporter ATP-binding protein [Elusimicrobiota bacterium]